MRKSRFVFATCGLAIVLAAPAFGQRAGGAPSQDPAGDPTKVLVGRLDLERYKATIKGLTQFGDRQQGTDRNRRAVDWIEAQLRGYGCATERLHYTYDVARPQALPGSRT